MTAEGGASVASVKELVATAYNKLQNQYKLDRKFAGLDREQIFQGWANCKQLFAPDITSELIAYHEDHASEKLLARINLGLLECGESRLVSALSTNKDGEFIFILVLRD